jgi:hypothetical protein
MLGRLLTVLLLFVMLAGMFPASTLTAQGYYETRLGALAGAESFGLTYWTVGAIGAKIGQTFGSQPWQGLSDDDKQRTLKEYFASADEANDLEGQIWGLANRGVTGADPQMADLEGKLRVLRQKRAEQGIIVERVLADQVQKVLKEQNTTLFEARSLFFPPVFFRLIDLPHVLVVSYRDRFTMRSQVAMQRTITSQQTDDLEAAVDHDLGVSSLLVPIGGYSTYPTMIAGTAPRDFVVGAITHEWCHIYLMFRPLGEAYGKDGQVSAMNETVCSIFGDDIGALVLQEFYGAEKTPRPWEALPTPAPAAPPQPKATEPQGFNGNRELRKIYIAAEDKLKANDIAGAEAVMEQGRQYLAENGIYLRKLNQAFFAFYGSYAEGPDAIRSDPIGDDLRALRRNSPTIRDFLVTVAQMTSYDDLKKALGK